MLFPEEGLVYDYQLQDGGVSNSNADRGDDEDEGKNVEVKTNFIFRETESCQSSVQNHQ